ncbi:MAG: hypothetical protein JNJ75_13860 [Cyclobacteriaceae bacterium]|nr:hypothetical protein [Cyclobacteriaceae bacterium]
MNQVYICGTYFHVYVSMLKQLQHNDPTSKSLLILNDHTPGIEKLIPALLENGFVDDVILVPFRKIESAEKSNGSFLSRTLFRNRAMVRAVEQHSDILKSKSFIEASEINSFYLWGYPTAYFVMRFPNSYLRIIEDGARNYIIRISHAKLLKRKYLLRTYIGDGFDERVREINLQFPEQLDKRLRHKGTRLELRQMQDNLSARDNQRILNVFMNGETVQLNDQKKILIITQPLSEDNFVTEQYKVSLYAEMIEAHADDHEVYIKPHPRELTNYCEKLHRPFIEIPRSFPLEMFDLMENIRFDKGITIFSSGMGNLRCIAHKVHLGRDHIKELLPGKKLI